MIFEQRFLKARRAVIARRFSALNDMQQKAVLTTEGPLLLAGAGSGRTTVLINRIANLIAFGEGADSDEIPDYITEDDVEFLEQYLDHPSRKPAEGGSALRAPSGRAVVDPCHHVYEQGGKRAQGPAGEVTWRTGDGRVGDDVPRSLLPDLKARYRPV